MTKTVKEHFENCKSVARVVDDANALLTKVQKELCAARATLEALQDEQHPRVRMNVPYHMRTGSRDQMVELPETVIKWQIERINALLGDRA